jgi:hypothetical protein
MFKSEHKQLAVTAVVATLIAGTLTASGTFRAQTQTGGDAQFQPANTWEKPVDGGFQPFEQNARPTGDTWTRPMEGMPMQNPDMMQRRMPFQQGTQNSMPMMRMQQGQGQGQEGPMQDDSAQNEERMKAMQAKQLKMLQRREKKMQRTIAALGKRISKLETRLAAATDEEMQAYYERQIAQLQERLDDLEFDLELLQADIEEASATDE